MDVVNVREAFSQQVTGEAPGVGARKIASNKIVNKFERAESLFTNTLVLGSSTIVRTLHASVFGSVGNIIDGSDFYGYLVGKMED